MATKPNPRDDPRSSSIWSWGSVTLWSYKKLLKPWPSRTSWFPHENWWFSIVMLVSLPDGPSWARHGKRLTRPSSSTSSPGSISISWGWFLSHGGAPNHPVVPNFGAETPEASENVAGTSPLSFYGGLRRWFFMAFHEGKSMKIVWWGLPDLPSKWNMSSWDIPTLPKAKRPPAWWFQLWKIWCCRGSLPFIVEQSWT